MISIYDIKPAFQRLLKPILNGLIQIGVTPNQVTLLALLLSMVTGCFLMTGARWVLLALPLIMLIRMALNALDGMLAKARQMSTPMGEILNELGDVLADFSLYLPFIFYISPGWGVYSVICFTILAIITEFCGVLAKSMVSQRRYDGPMGKSDRAFAMSLFALLLFFLPEMAGRYSASWFGLLNILLIFTCMNRLRPCLRVN